MPSAYLLMPCPKLVFEIKTNGDLLNAFVDLNAQYQLCSARMDSLLQFFEGLKEAKLEPQN